MAMLESSSMLLRVYMWTRGRFLQCVPAAPEHRLKLLTSDVWSGLNYKCGEEKKSLEIKSNVKICKKKLSQKRKVVSVSDSLGQSLQCVYVPNQQKARLNWIIEIYSHISEASSSSNDDDDDECGWGTWNFYETYFVINYNLRKRGPDPFGGSISSKLFSIKIYEHSQNARLAELCTAKPEQIATSHSCTYFDVARENILKNKHKLFEQQTLLFQLITRRTRARV